MRSRLHIGHFAVFVYVMTVLLLFIVFVWSDYTPTGSWTDSEEKERVQATAEVTAEAYRRLCYFNYFVVGDF